MKWKNSSSSRISSNRMKKVIRISSIPIVNWLSYISSIYEIEFNSHQVQSKKKTGNIVNQTNSTVSLSSPGGFLKATYCSLLSLKNKKIKFEKFYQKLNSYADNFFLILIIINPVNHLAAIYPINPKKIEQIIVGIDPTNNVEPIVIPAIDIPNADKLPNPAWIICWR